MPVRTPIAHKLYVGTAAWNIPRGAQAAFPSEGSHLERYSQILNCVEINSCFYKDHKPQTYERWGESVPENFRFSLKLSMRFTHDKDQNFSTEDLSATLSGMKSLGRKWRVLLLQFPGSLEFKEKKMKVFYKALRKNFDGRIVVEPRNLSWVSKEAVALMKDYDLGKVIADPEKCPYPKGIGTLDYYRLHGSPSIYKSSYTEEYLKNLSENFRRKENWVVFDNTTFGHATENALWLLGQQSRQ